MTVSLRVLHVTPSFHPAYVYGGPTHSLYALTRALAEHGHDVRVLTTNANGRDRTLEVDTSRDVVLQPNLRVHYAPRVGHTVSPTLARLLPEYVKWADVVHLTAVYSFPTIPTLATCRVLDAALVWSPRGSLQRWTGTRRVGPKKAWELACRRLLPRRAALHVTSEAEAASSSARIPELPAVVIPNCIEVPPETSRPASAQLRLLFLGRVDPIKALENVLDACAELPPGLDWSLKVAGEGEPEYVRSLRERGDRLGLGERVRFIGWVSAERKAELFADSDVLVLASHTENFGMVVAEALAHGVPVVAGTGTPWGVLRDERCGEWVSNTPADLAGAILRLSRADRAAMSLRARAWASRTLGASAIAERTTGLYEQVRAGAVRRTGS
jgi:glycosyltransferase involved in cell wall biosynthesis